MGAGVFLIDESNQLTEMPTSDYVSEDDLQALIAQFPRLMASVVDEDEMTWLLVARELGIADSGESGSRWSLDHLFIDKQAVPVLVEVKRSSDTRIRREVVGQMMDYAANAVAYWSLEHVQRSFASECERRGVNQVDELRRVFGEELDVDAFWQTVKTNLQAGRIRMVFLADTIPDELRRIIEFLNQQMDPAEVIGIEIKRYGSGAVKTVVPTLVGRTAIAVNRKHPRTGGIANKELLDATMNAFNELVKGAYHAVDNGKDYRQIRIGNWPDLVHYEFMSKVKTGVTAEIHVEVAGCDGVTRLLAELAQQPDLVPNSSVTFDPSWSKGGRLRYSCKQPDDHTALAALMLNVINRTRPLVSAAL